MSPAPKVTTEWRNLGWGRDELKKPSPKVILGLKYPTRL
jgi:hypothetical protein